jgi:hypothetical protein
MVDYWGHVNQLRPLTTITERSPITTKLSRWCRSLRVTKHKLLRDQTEPNNEEWIHTCYSLFTIGVLINLQLRFSNHSNRPNNSLEHKYMCLTILGFQEALNARMSRVHVGQQLKCLNSTLNQKYTSKLPGAFFGASLENFGAFLQT